MKRLLLFPVLTLLLASCSSSELREEIEEPVIESGDCINFTNVAMEEMPERQTRSTQLSTGFVVSTFKGYGSAGQHTVMDRYRVEYRTSGSAWDGTQRPYWTYIGVGDQYEKYWDYSSFPYRFHAIAPIPYDMAGYALSGDALTIPATFWMQTCHDGEIIPIDAEPCLVAQVQRNTDGTDMDIFAGNQINKNSNSKNRDVRLPFHHLNSKIRFGIYSLSHWTTANPLYIKDLSVNVVSRDFVTQAGGYSVSGSDSWYKGNGNSGFNTLVTALNPTTELLHFSGGQNVPGNDLSHAQGASSIFWLQDKDGFMQIPQENVRMTVSFKLYQIGSDGTSEPYRTYTDVPVKLQDGTSVFQWKSGYFHTYNLIITDVSDQLDITFTATLTPWEDIGGSLSTDLEQ